MALKEQQTKHDLAAGELKRALEVEQERVTEAERELESLEQTYEHSRTDWEELELKLRATINDLERELESLRQALDRREEEHREKMQTDQQERESAMGVLKGKVGGLEQHLREKESSIKALELSIQNDTAMLT